MASWTCFGVTEARVAAGINSRRTPCRQGKIWRSCDATQLVLVEKEETSGLPETQDAEDRNSNEGTIPHGRPIVSRRLARFVVSINGDCRIRSCRPARTSISTPDSLPAPFVPQIPIQSGSAFGGESTARPTFSNKRIRRHAQISAHPSAARHASSPAAPRDETASRATS